MPVRRRRPRVTGELSFRILQANDFDRLTGRARGWDRILDNQLKAELGAAAKDAVRDAQRRALRLNLSPRPPARRPRPHGATSLRSDIARGVTVIAREAGGGVEYRLRAGHPMSFATNKSRFNHPVFGNREVWVTQNSQPWWSMAMAANAPKMRAAADRALERAVRRF